MAENNEWKPMSGSRRFGIYTETIHKPERSGSKKCCLFGVILAAGIVLVFLTVLSISTGKGRHIIRAQGSGIKVEDWATGSKAGGINATEWAKTDGEPSIPRPDVSETDIKPLESKTIDDDISSTEEIFNDAASDNSPITEITEQTLNGNYASRQGRIINDPMNDHEIDTPPKFTHRPLRFENIPSATVTSIGGGFHFENRWNALKGLNGIGDEDLKFAADERQTISTFPQMPAIKFTGVYVRGPPEDIENMSLDNVETHLNGHAYTSDPFKAYKPAHPSEINHLATAPSELDTGPRFSNKMRPSTSTVSNDAASGASNVGSFSQSVLFPQDSSKVRFPPVLGLPTIPDNRKPDPNSRPLKIMLDIYPVQRPSGIVNHDSSELERPVRLNHPPRYQRQPTVPPQATTPTPAQPNRMIVHLNLFPRKAKKNSHQRGTTPYPALMSFVPGGGPQFQDRISSEDQEEEEDTTIAIVRKINPKSINGTSDVSIEIAETYQDNEFPFISSRETGKPFKLPYDLIIGKERSKTSRKDVDENEIREGKRRGKSPLESTNEDNRQTENVKNEKILNEFKIVQFHVSSGGETIDQNGVIRSIFGSKGDTSLHREEMGRRFAKTDNVNFTSDIDVSGAENDWEEGDGALTGPSTFDGKINKNPEKMPASWIETADDGFSFADDDDDRTFPIGTAVDTTERLEMYMTPPYDSGKGIEPRIDAEEGRRRMSQQINVRLSTSSGPPIVFPTSILQLPLEMTTPVSVKKTESLLDEKASKTT